MYSQEQIEAAARAAHEVNRVYCREVMNDPSHLLWKDAPEWQQESAVEGVKAIIKNPETTPEQNHEGWMRLKLEAGWIHGQTKNEVTKTHPCLVNYINLPLGQRVKDSLFGAVVRASLGIGE